MAAGERSAFALGKMRTMAGWLDGIIEAAQYQNRLIAEANAYAREKVKAERGIGFRSPEGSDTP